jgi:hypothetical protein
MTFRCTLPEEVITVKSTSTFQYAMRFGHEALDKGDLGDAKGRFSAAFAEASAPDERALSGQMVGVVTRLDGDLQSAEVRLIGALEDANGFLALTAKIRRDLGMVYLDSGRVPEARYEFAISHNGLKRMLGDHKTFSINPPCPRALSGASLF